MLQTMHYLHGRETTRLSTILDGLSDGFYSLDREWRFVEFNAAEANLGLTREDAIGVAIYRALPCFAESQIDLRLRQVRAAGRPVVFEAPSAIRSGHVIEFNVFPLDDGLGVSFRDVTQARWAEAGLRESQARLEIAATAADLGIWDWHIA